MKYISFSLLAFLFLTSCEDVIELDLKESEPRIVIEAIVDATTGISTIDISKTNNFYDNNELTKIDNATAILEGGTGPTLTFENTGDGLYSLEGLTVLSGEEYQLEINIGDVSYKAKTTAPFPVELTKVDTSSVVPPFGGEGRIVRLLGNWNDPIGQQNFYRLRSFTDGEYDFGVYALIKDGENDGQPIFRPIMEPFQPGSSVIFELLSVDENYYNYFTQLSANQSQGLSSSVPFNPLGNIDNGALGYFGITHSSQILLQL